MATHEHGHPPRTDAPPGAGPGIGDHPESDPATRTGDHAPASAKGDLAAGTGDDHGAGSTVDAICTDGERDHPHGRAEGHSDGDGHGHSHGPGPGSDARLLVGALALILAFMTGEVVIGFAVGSLALLSDAAHMLTDAGAIGSP